ncbi:SDR family NAD(P)-dependent oxidoreductase [Marinobacter salarius]|uniref:SDR family NAD(P)-dependent oxidoreductase n=1 Tax=Marinobacter salarius TaxID=1420917 RepID=UPI000F84EE10|nr:SDR family NAD(P)-dependent oxidoreductase [Marinobacter salarius]AZR42030.1 7-alpha-hydroxysteroid dehydrogenase [Marinobacter salarius]
MFQKQRLTHQSRAVITGSGSGIGKALALELARRKGLIVCSDISLQAAEQTAREVRAEGGEAWAVACDVSDLAQVEALAQQAQELLPQPLNLVINNAGIGIGGQKIGDVPIADWTWTININLWGVIHGCHVFTPLLKGQPAAGIINVASTAAFSAAPLMGPYNATKAAALAISETLAAELSETNVQVTALCPTLVKTNIAANGRITGDSGALFNRLMDRFGMSAEQVARITLNGLDRGQLYVMPQLDAKLIWRLKRLLPSGYAVGTGLLNRFVSRTGRVTEEETTRGRLHG